MTALLAVLRAFLLGAGAGALAAYLLHEPVSAPVRLAAPTPEAAPTAGDPSPAAALTPGARAQEFAGLEDRIAVADQALQRISIQLQQQDKILKEQKPAGAVFDEAFWQTRQDSLLAEKAAREGERAQLESEYQRYRCSNNRYRPECWH